MLHTWLLVVQLMVATASLVGIVFGVVKVVNRNEDEWRERERRLIQVEADIQMLKPLHVEVAGVRGQHLEFVSEMHRVRDRLDRFIDMERGKL